MENSSPPVKKPAAFGLVAAAAVTGAAVCVFPFALLVAPALWTAAMFRTRPWALLPLFAATFALFFLIYPPVAAAAIALLLALPALILYVMQSRRVGNSYTLAVAAAACILVLYAAICLPGILNGSGAFAGAQAFVDQALAASREAAAGMLSGVSGDVLESYDAYTKSISAAVPTATVPVLCFAGILIALANFLFFRLFVRRVKPAITPLRAFRFWAVPQTFSAGIFVFLFGSLGLELLGADYAPGVSSTVNVLVGIPLMLQGLSVVDFLIVRRGGRIQARRTLFYVAIGLLLPLLQTALMLLGCMEQLMHYRDRAGLIPPTTPKNP